MASQGDKNLNDIYEAVGEIKGLLSGLPDAVKDHEKRIGKLELKMWVVWASLAGVVAIAYVVVQEVISKLVHGAIS